MIAELMTLLPDWFLRHAVVLLVVAPMLAAPFCVALTNGRLTWLITLVTTVISLLCALVLVGQTADGQVISYALGGWAPPLGIEFRVDGLNAPILLLIAGMGLLAAIFSWPTVVAEVREEKRHLFFTAFLMCFSGLAGVAVTGDAFNLFVFLEISSLSTYVLVALGARQDRRALPAAFNYLIMGTLGATFYVIGVGFLYAATGTLNMFDIAQRLPELQDSRVVQAGFAFVIIGLAVKAAMFPLHQWLPSSYAYAPSVVTVFLSATATKVAFYALVRMLFLVFNPELEFNRAAFVALLAPLGAIAALACSFQALFQTDVRRTLAYSSVAQVGYMILALSIGTGEGVSASLFHLINHALLKGALFMAVAAVALRIGGTKLSDFDGVARGAPWTMVAFAIAALSLIGVPLTAGFLSKVAIFQAALGAGWWWAAMVIAAASVLAVLYMGRILERAFFRAPPAGQTTMREAPLLMIVPLWVLALANLYIGVDASFVTGLTAAAADAVGLGGAR